MKRLQRLMVHALVAATCVFSNAAPASGQRVNIHSNTERGGVEVTQIPGRKIGNVTTSGNVVGLELDSGVIADHNLFDLDRRTLRFTPAAGGFRVENRPLAWDSAQGPAIQGNTVRLTKFAFPFSGRTWDSLKVQNSGSSPLEAAITIWDSTASSTCRRRVPAMVNKIPVIAAFFMKLRIRYPGT